MSLIKVISTLLILILSASVNFVFCSGNGFTLAELNLAKVIQTQEEFFNFADKENQIEEIEMTRKAQEIVSSYESHISENPEDYYALILFGKFLQKVGQEEHAIDYFLKADLINPKLAVVKQQIANYLIKQDKIIDAFPFYLMAIEIAPKEATYHFELGAYLTLFLDDLVKAEILDYDTGQTLMHDSFKEAHSLLPKSFEFALRYGQSFFDISDADMIKANKFWSSLLDEFPDLSKSEIDYINLCKARILIQLNRVGEAKLLINSVTSQNLINSKVSLLEQIKKPTPSKTYNQTKPNQKKQKTGFLFPSDRHLFRMRAVSQRLAEEKLLSEFKLDVIKASLGQDGYITVELSSKKSL